MSKRLLFAVTIALLCLSLPSLARASGFLVARFGGEDGHPTSGHPSSIYFNPAGLALGSGTRIDVEGIIAFRTAEYDRPVEAIDHPRQPGEPGAGTPNDAFDANAGNASLSNVVAAPFLGIASDLGIENLGVGAGLSVPFGGSASWDKNQELDDPRYPGAVDGTQRWHAIEGSLRSMYFSAGGAYRIPAARLAVGLTLNVVRSSIDVVRARNANGTDDLVTGSGGLQEGRSLIQASGTTVSAAAGLIWEPIDGFRIGASYQSQPGFGEMSLEGTLTNKLGVTPVTSSRIEIQQSLPDVWRAGVRWREDRLEVYVAGDYVRWSVFDRQCLLDLDDPNRRCSLTADGGQAADGAGILVNNQRNWHDAWGVRMGLSYDVRKTLSLSVGWLYDGNAVPDETIDPGLMDMEKFAVSAGARFRLPQQRLAFVANWSQFFYLSRNVAARARDANGETVTLGLPSRTPDGAGTYRQSIGALTLAVEYWF